MRSFLLLSCILMGLLGWLTATAARAEADTGIDQYLSDIHALGWYGRTAGDGDLIRNGYLICDMLHRYNGATVAETVYLNTGFDVSRQDAASLVIITANDLCPSTIHTGATA